jgi:hypothetical protein
MSTKDTTPPVQAKALTDAEIDALSKAAKLHVSEYFDANPAATYSVNIERRMYIRALLASQPSAGTVSELRCDSLCDMHYTRGLEQGFMYGGRGDYDGFLKTQKSREGYIATLKETRGESAQADVAAVRDAALEEAAQINDQWAAVRIDMFGGTALTNAAYAIRALKSAAPTAQPQADGVVK